MQTIHLPNITTKSEEDNSAVFEIAPLHRGYGVTLGNSLRRVLLSSLSGGAVTAFGIEGVDHEFTAVDGIKEDAIQIIINLKQIRFKIYSDEPQTLELKKKGKGQVTAADIATNADVEIANPDQVIATLDNDKTTLKMTLRVEKGRGYITVDEYEHQLPVGMIAIDALFSPIERVRYRVENTRVEQVTDLDKLTIEIFTDGTMTPKEALSQAATVLMNQFSIIAGGELPTAGIPQEDTDEDELNIGIDELSLSSRTSNALARNDITTLKQLASMSENELKGLKGFGSKAQEEVIAKLKELELK